MEKSSENKTLISTVDRPDSNLSPSYAGRSLESAFSQPLIEFPNPKNMPKISDGFSNAKSKIKTIRKVKIRERKFSTSQLTPITNFFRKKID